MHIEGAVYAKRTSPQLKSENRPVQRDLEPVRRVFRVHSRHGESLVQVDVTVHAQFTFVGKLSLPTFFRHARRALLLASALAAAFGAGHSSFGR
jgi:hypothetical protein